MYILILTILLIFSAFFSGSETAFFSFDKLRMGQIEKLKIPASRRVMKLLKDPYRLLVTLLVGNTIVNIAASAVFTEFFLSRMGENGIGVSIVLMTVIVLIFGEVTPKMFALSHGEKMAFMTALPIKVLDTLFSPMRVVLTSIAKYILRSFGVKTSISVPTVTEREIRSILHISRKHGVVKKKEKDMIEGIFEFKELNAADIMTPRIDVEALDLTLKEEKLIEQMKESQYSRYPAYVHTLDNIVGIVHAKDFLIAQDVLVKDIVKKPFFAPENMRIDDLLREMQKKHTHMSVVTDEYGVTSGVVTIEDILEEIVGEIRDELDFEAPNIHMISKNTYEVDGRTHIDEVNEKLGTGIETEEVDTIGGFVILSMGKIPRSGDRVESDGFSFIVNDVSKNRVTKLTIEKISR
ncbi:MAG: hemolysin family protein [Candidatus Aadella gelida]|nr:hemolysin family protein [Candidatus Aadella gelida]